MSSLSRAFTTRRVKQSIDLSDAARGKERSNNFMQRSKTTKTPPTLRNKISAPMELVHTTNMLSYNAPDIRPRANSSSNSLSNSSTKSSDEDSEGTDSAASSPPTSPDVAPHERSSSPEPNHLSCYFVAPGQAVGPSTGPEVPQRAPSHTKKASFDAVARQRSFSTLSKASVKTVSTKVSRTFSSRASSGSSAVSTASHDSVAKAAPRMPSPAFQQPKQEKSVEPHPFGRELAQVTEIAEEFGFKDRVADADEQALKSQGLHKFSAEDYVAEVQSVLANFFSSESHAAPQRPMAAAWI